MRFGNHFPTSKLDIVASDGTVRSSTVGIVDKNSILLEDASLVIEVGDEIRRTLPNGHEEVFVVEDNKHHTEPDVGPMVCQALLWLAVNGPLGEKILPFMREGGPNMAVHQEISLVGGETYNFRTTVDEKTSASLLASDS